VQNTGTKINQSGRKLFANNYLLLFWGLLVSIFFGQFQVAGNTAPDKPFRADPNTVLLLHFDKADGLPQDSSAFKNHPDYNTAKYSAQGRFGGCLYFDGKSAYLKIPDSESLNLRDSREMTIEAWVKPHGYIGRSPGIINKYNAAGGYLLSPWYNKMSFCLRRDKKIFSQLCAAGLPPVGEWSHIMGIVENGRAGLYINGKLVNLRKLTGGFFSPVALPLIIGSYHGGYWNGLIDEVRISNIARHHLPAETKNNISVSLNTTIKTPHIKWMPSIAGKNNSSISCLAIYPPTAQRDIVELKERINNIEIMPVPLNTYQNFDAAWWNIPKAAAMRLVDKYLSRRPELIIIGNIPWRKIETAQRGKILKAVESGAILLLTGHDNGEINSLDIKWENPFENIKLKPVCRLGAARFKKSDIRYGKKGKGKIIQISNYPQNNFNAVTPMVFSYWDYEFSQAMISKILLYLFNGQSRYAVKNISYSASERAIHAEIKTGNKINADLTVYDAAGKEKYRSRALAISGGKCKFSIPRLDFGGYIAVLRLHEDKKLVDFDLTEIKVKASPDYTVKLEKTAYKPGDKVRGEIVFPKSVPPDATLKIKLTDNYQRVVDTVVRNAADELKFELDPQESLTNIMYVETTLLQNDKKLFTTQSKPLAYEITFPNPDDFKLLLWGIDSSERNDYLNMLFWKTLSSRYQYNINGVLVARGFLKGNAPRSGVYEKTCLKFSELNLRVLPYLTRFRDYSKDANVRKPCLSCPDYLKSLKTILSHRVSACVKYSPIGYSIGDENRIGPMGADYCFSENCRKNFIIYLKNKYNDLKSLNSAWDTVLPDWESIRPLTLKAAIQNKKMRMWMDHREYMEKKFSDVHAYAAAIINKIDPDALVGIDGTGSPNSFNGLNYPRLCSVLGFCSPYYNHDSLEAVRSFKNNNPLGYTFFGGYDNDSRKAETWPWMYLFHAFGSVTLYNAFPGSLWPLFKGDFAPFSAFAVAYREIGKIKSGIGKLLLNMTRDNDDIAVLYSQASMFASTFSPSFGSSVKSRSEFIQLLEDTGFQYTYITPKNLKGNGLEKYKVLVLPYISVLDDKEIKAVREFVRRGGIVIADIGTGWYNKSGGGLVNELFGIRRGNKHARIFVDTGIWANGQVEENVTLTDGKPLLKSDAAPVLVKNTFGRGRTLYFNFAFDRYSSYRQKPEGKRFRKLIAAFLAKSGIRPGTAADDANLYEFVHFFSENLDCVGILPAGSENSGKSRLVFSGPKRHIYNVTEHKYCGFDNRTETESGSHPRLYALLPYKIPAPLLSADRKVIEPGQRLQFKIELKIPGYTPANHVFRIEILDVNGNVIPYYSRNLLSRQGRIADKLFLAFNQKTGKYTIRATEVVSGQMAETDFNIADKETGK